MASFISTIKRHLKIHRTRRRILQCRSGDRAAVIVYQMGKVASSSIYHSLRKRDDLCAFHTHHLNPKGFIDGKVKSFWGADKRVCCSQDLSRILIQPKCEVKIITLYRDPFARNVSAFFESSPLTRLKKYQNPDNLEELIDSFLEQVNPNSIRRWFEREFKESLGIDFLQHPFDAKKGIGRIQVAPYDVLVLATSISDADKAVAVEGFLGIDGFTLQNENRTDNKKSEVSDLYCRFKAKVKYPRNIVDEVLADAYTQKLFTENEISEMRSRWSQ